jgi:predicted amidohydrolase YtcJ
MFAGACQEAAKEPVAEQVPSEEVVPEKELDRRIGINGKIYTSNPEQPWAEAIVVEGQNTVYVGDNEGALEFETEDSVVGNLRGKMVLPGMIGTHEHGTMLMALSSGLTMEFSRDAEIMLNNVREYVAANPDSPYFSFGGAFEGTVEIYLDDIDAIISDQPFLMIAASGHGGWANTKALEMAGIVKDELDPIDSFGREEAARPMATWRLQRRCST